ncbi:MAG: hypothetical protein ACRC62_24885 [Microcoleus sp.]
MSDDSRIMQLLPKLKSRWILFLFPLLAGGIYLAIPKPPVSCKSLQQFGAIEQEGRCIIKRSVTIQGNIKRLPDRLTIQGSLTISGTYITELPAGMLVERDLFLYKTSIAKLPPDLQVGGGFDQYSGFGSPGVRCDAIPKTAIVKGHRNCHS